MAGKGKIQDVGSDWSGTYFGGVDSGEGGASNSSEDAYDGRRIDALDTRKRYGIWAGWCAGD